MRIAKINIFHMASTLVFILLASCIPFNEDKSPNIINIPNQAGISEKFDLSPSAMEVIFPKATERATNNGIPVLLIKDNDSLFTTFILSINSGSFDDPPGKEGLSLLTARSIIYNSDSDLLKVLDNCGGTIKILTDNISTKFILVFPSNNFNDVISSFHKAFYVPIFSIDSINLQKSILFSQVAEHKNNLINLSENVIDRILTKGASKFPGNSKGTSSSISSIDRDDLMQCFNSHYSNNNFIIGLSGRIDFEIYMGMLNEIWKDPFSKSANIPKQRFNYIKKLSNSKNIFIHKVNKVDDIRIEFGQRFKTEHIRQFSLLYLTYTLFSAYPKGFLAEFIDKNKHKLSEVKTNLNIYPGATILTWGFNTAPQDYQAFIIRAKAEYRYLIYHKLRLEEFNFIKAASTNGLYNKFNTPQKALQEYINLKQLGLDIYYYQKVIKDIGNIESFQLHDYLVKNIKPGALKIIISGNIESSD